MREDEIKRETGIVSFVEAFYLEIVRWDIPLYCGINKNAKQSWVVSGRVSVSSPMVPWVIWTVEYEEEDMDKETSSIQYKNIYYLLTPTY